MRLVDADKILADFPIREDNYDKENGSEDFIIGIETVLEYIDCIADEQKVVRCKDCPVCNADHEHIDNLAEKYCLREEK